MRALPRLGPANLALTAFYFVPIWGGGALRALKSPTSGFEDRVHTAAASYLQNLFGFGLDGLVWTSNLLAGIKLIAAASLIAYAIEFLRAVVIGRDVDRPTLHAVLALSLTSIALCTLGAWMLNDAALIRHYATESLLVTGALIVIIVERQIDVPASDVSMVAAPQREPDPRLIMFERGRHF